MEEYSELIHLSLLISYKNTMWGTSCLYFISRGMFPLFFPVLQGTRQEGAEYKLLPGGPSNDAKNMIKDFAEPEVSIL